MEKDHLPAMTSGHWEFLTKLAFGSLTSTQLWRLMVSPRTIMSSVRLLEHLYAILIDPHFRADPLQQLEEVVYEKPNVTSSCRLQEGANNR